MITMIAAAGENNALGKNQKLLWHLPDDFKRFKKLTTGHHIIMGRKTFETFPKLLPNRTHVIITRQRDYKPKGCVVVHSMEEALAVGQDDEEQFIIGGGEIYKLGLPFSDKIELTRVHQSFNGDAFFPELDMDNWELEEEVVHPKDERHAQDFTYFTYLRKNK